MLFIADYFLIVLCGLKCLLLTLRVLASISRRIQNNKYGSLNCRSNALFTDPQTLTINAVANTLPRVENNGTKSVYTKDDGNVSLVVSHQKVKNRIRSTVRVDYRELNADPITTGHNLTYTTACYVVIDRGDGEFTNAKVKQIVDALTAWMTANSGANVTKVLGRES